MEPNRKGWIPGPEEDEKHFLARTKTLKHFFSYPPEDLDHFLTDGDWQGAWLITENLYGFAPDWIVGYYSNRKLSFFQGAATWITKQEEVQIPLIQLKEKFETGSLHKLYRREEVLAHEAVHAARMQFEEPIFEEFFAYKTSPHGWRRFFGPLFQRPWEAYLLLILLLIPFGIEAARFFYPDLPMVFTFLPALYLTILLLRLSLLHLTLWLGLRRFQSYLREPKRKWAAALYLKDREIFQFAYLPKKRLEKALKKEKGFRWKLLREYYFKK